MAENIDGQKRYECDFVETLPKDLECSICLSVLREPNLNDCCGQHFCQACIQRIIDDNKPCPLCNEANFTVILDKKTQRKILELLVKCRRHQSGCEWVGELKSLEQHCGICEYVEVDCPNSCGETIQRRLRSYHLESECPKRHFVCTYCGHESTHGDIKTEHWPTCEQFPVSCKNSCGAENIPRCKEEAHRLEDCPLQEVECKYKYVGCEEKVKRKDVDAHMEMEMKKHLELMESHAEELKEKNEELRKMIDETQSSSIHILTMHLKSSSKLDALEKRNCVYTQKSHSDMFVNITQSIEVVYSLHSMTKCTECNFGSILVKVTNWQWRLEYWVGIIHITPHGHSRPLLLLNWYILMVPWSR